MKYKFIKENQDIFSIRLMCKVFTLNKSSYYKWKNKPISTNEEKDLKISKHIKDIFDNSRETYGILRIKSDLKKLGYSCSENRISRLMKKNNLFVKCRKKFKATTNSKHNYPIADNLLNQDFKATSPNQKWVGDITYIATEEGWLYLATIIDLYSKQVIGRSMSNRMTKELCIDALNRAIGRTNPDPGLIFHSDRGSQYASNRYKEILKRNGILQSMSRKGNCYDNACAESFFSTLKTELIQGKRYKTREEAKLDVTDYIETFYNSKRVHSSLGYMSPNEFLKEYYSNNKKKAA